MTQVVKYRPDIDGLRAIAVLLVIFFHAGASFIPGGFIGVDVFFVISGYLITTIIYREQKRGQFTFKSFYQRRITRILPAFYTVVFFTLITAAFLFTPEDFKNAVNSARYAAGFISNVHFYRATDYFAQASELQPLLHTWSLSIEEQFYIFWPIFLLLFAKKLEAREILILSFCFLVGLTVLSELFSQHSPSKAYYLLPYRAFELMVGAVLALYLIEKPTQKLSPLLANILSIASLLCIFYPAFIGLNHGSTFPGLNALLPCIGTALVIYTGQQNNTIIKKILSQRLFVFTGLLSYSLYLWHWPIMAFLRYCMPEFTTQLAILSIITTYVLAYFSWKFVEQPLRSYQSKKFITTLILFFIIPASITAIGYKITKKNHGFPERLDAQVVSAANNTLSQFQADISTDPDIPYLDPYLLGNKGATPTAILIGDSHAMHFRPLFDQLAKQHNTSLYSLTTAGCPPLFGVSMYKKSSFNDACEAMLEKMTQAITISEVKTIYLSARWAIYANSSRVENEKGSNVYLADNISSEKSVKNTARVFKDGLKRTLKALEETGKHVIILEQVPAHSFNASNCAIKQKMFNQNIFNNCRSKYSDIKERLSYSHNLINDFIDETSIRTSSINHLLCPDSLCLSEIEDTPLYYDNNHINRDGAELIADKLDSSHLIVQQIKDDARQ